MSRLKLRYTVYRMLTEQQLISFSAQNCTSKLKENVECIKSQFESDIFKHHTVILFYVACLLHVLLQSFLLIGGLHCFQL